MSLIALLFGFFSLSQAIIPVPQMRRILTNSGQQSGDFSICISITLKEHGKVFHSNEQQDYSGTCPQSSEMVAGIRNYFATHNSEFTVKVEAGACASMPNACYLEKVGTYAKALPGGCCMAEKVQIPNGKETCSELPGFSQAPVKACSSETQVCMTQDNTEFQMTFTGTSCPTFAEISQLGSMTEGPCASMGNDFCYVTKGAEQQGLPSPFPKGCCVSTKIAKPTTGPVSQKTCQLWDADFTDTDSPFCGGEAMPHTSGAPEMEEISTTFRNLVNLYAHNGTEKEDFTPMLITTFAIYAFVMGLIVLFFCTGGFACCKSDDYDSDEESVTDTEMAAKNHKRAMDDFAFRRMSLTGAPDMMSDRRLPSKY